MHGIKYRKMLDEPHRQFAVVPCDLPSSELPTRGQVVGRIMKLRVEKMAVRGTDEKHVPVEPIISQVAAEVADIWARSSVPSRRIDRVVTKITALWGKKVRSCRGYERAAEHFSFRRFRHSYCMDTNGRLQRFRLLINRLPSY